MTCSAPSHSPVSVQRCLADLYPVSREDSPVREYTQLVGEVVLLRGMIVGQSSRAAADIVDVDRSLRVSPGQCDPGEVPSVTTGTR
jgi:hypothetical protein